MFDKDKENNKKISKKYLVLFYSNLILIVVATALMINTYKSINHGIFLNGVGETIFIFFTLFVTIAILAIEYIVLMTKKDKKKGKNIWLSLFKNILLALIIATLIVLIVAFIIRINNQAYN